MPKTLLEKCCVRLTVTNNQKVIHGSGLVFSHNQSFYVITAAHCICEDDYDFSQIKPDNIVIEHQADYQSSFRSIPVVKIHQVDHSFDFGLVEIVDPEIQANYSAMQLGTNFLDEEKVYFVGYQKMARNTKRIWNAKIIQLAEDHFRITLLDKSFEQGGNLGALVAAGLSGSGVYIIRGNMLYLIGYLKNVDGNNANNDDVSCCRIAKIEWLSQAKSLIDLGDPDLLAAWEAATEKAISDNDVDAWISTNDQYFANLLRKSTVLYGEEKGKIEARRKLLDFLHQEHKNNKIRNSSDLISRYERLSETFERLVKSDYTRSVESRSEAKDLSIKLQREFSEYIAQLTSDKKNPLNLELAIHKTTWWLLNCSFDFTD